MLRKYMIGDEYGNMWTGKNDDFQSRGGYIFCVKKDAKDAREKLLNTYTRLEEHILKIWVLNVEDESNCSESDIEDMSEIGFNPRKVVNIKARVKSAERRNF